MGTHPIFESDFDCLTDEKHMDEDVGLGQLLEAIHSYEYEAESKDGSKRKITMHKGDRFILLRTANVEWWDVIHYDYRERPEKKFYVPAKYVRPLELVLGAGDCDHEDFKRRIDKNSRRQRKQNRRTQDNRLSTFDDGTMLDPSISTTAEPYQPSLGVSTLTRTQLRRGSDSEFGNGTPTTLPKEVALTEPSNVSPHLKRITPVPPPTLDSQRDLLTPEPDFSDFEETTTRKSPQLIKRRDMGMSMTANTARRLDAMPEAVKPKPVKPSVTRRSIEERTNSPVEQHHHQRFSSLGSNVDQPAAPKPRLQSESDNVFDGSKPSWTCEVDADTGNRYWFATFTAVRWRECYDAQTNNYYYWNEEDNTVIWELPEKPDELELKSPNSESVVPKTPNLTSKRGTILYHRFEPGKKVSKVLNGWGEIHGNFLNIYKTAPKMQGGGTIYNVEPEIRIDFYRSKIRNPSNGWKTKKIEDSIKYFDITSPHLKFETLIKDENCWLQEISEKHKAVNNRQRWSTRKSVRNIDLTKFERAFERHQSSTPPPGTTTTSNNATPPPAKSKTLPKKKANESQQQEARWTLNGLFRKGTNRERRKELVKRGIIKNNYFGSPIPDIIRNEKSKVPEFITWCIEHIERDIEQDGIYRVAANQATVHALRLDVDRGVERTKWKYGNEVHVVCGALKLFFRELPEALINPKTDTQYQQWTELPNFDKATLFKQVGKLLKNSIDEQLKPTLKALFDHFENVLAHAAANRMAAQNMAIVFGPTLMAPGQAPSYQSVTTHNRVIQTLLENYGELKPLFS